MGEEKDVHGLCSQETGVRIDKRNSNIDEPNIQDSSKTNDANAEQTNSIVDDDVEQNEVSKNISQGLQNKTVSNDVGMEKADEMEGSSVILGQQNIVHDRETFIQDQLTTVDFNNDEDQISQKTMMIEVKVASLTTVISLKYLQSNHKVNLNYNSSVDYLH